MIPQHVFADNFQLQRVMQALVPHLFEIHRYGMPCGPADFNESVLVYKYEHSRVRLANLKRKLFDLVGYELNLGSWQQMQELLYGKLGLDPAPIIKATGKSSVNQFKNELVPTKWDNPFSPGETVFGCKPKEYLASSTDKYALCMLHYLNRQDPKLDEIFNTMIELRKLEKTISNQYAKLLLTEDCECAKSKNSDLCMKCGGTKRGKVLGYDPYYTSVWDGWVYTHTTYIQNQATLRIGGLDPAVPTTPRGNHTRKLYPRDIWATRPGRKLVENDLSKAEMLFCSVYFDDPVMLGAVRGGHKAMADFGMRWLGYQEHEVAKGREGYNNTKTAFYACLLGIEGMGLHKTLINNYAYFSEEKCWEIIKSIMQTFPFHQKKFGLAWEAIEKGYYVNYFGQRFIVQRPYELEGIRDWKQIKGEKAKAAFTAFVRLFSATLIQAPATGINTQIAALRFCEEKAKRPQLRDCHLVALIHDAFIVDCPDECVDEIAELSDYCLAKCFEKPQPYLDKVMRPELFFGMSTESSAGRQWALDPNKEYKNAEWRNGLLYRA